MANHKIERIATEILRYVNQILLEEIEDKDLKTITLTECKVTNDLSYASLYFTSFSDFSKEEMEEKLKEASGFIRGKLSGLIDLRHTPTLKFIYDETIENGNKIEKIIHEINNN